MNEIAKTMATAASGMRAQAARVRLSSENIANADTPGYRRKTVSFEV
jgi:flagellar basal-body rod protein FlgC